MPSRRVRTQTYLSPENLAALESMVKSQGGRMGGVTRSKLVNQAVTEYLARQSAERQEELLLPLMQTMLARQLDRLESWLRPMVANTGINATAGMLAALEVLGGNQVAPERMKEYYDLLRGRAYKMFKRPPEEERGAS